MRDSIVDAVEELIARVDENSVQASSLIQELAVIRKQLEAKGQELEKVVGERDAQAKEKGEAQQVVKDLRKQLEAQAKEKGEAQQVVKDLRKQLEAMGGELQKVVEEREAQAEEKGEAEQAVEDLREQLEAKGGELAQKESQVQDASEEAEMILMQLHQVQEELEDYFLLTRRQSEMLDSCTQLQKRTASLLIQTRILKTVKVI